MTDIFYKMRLIPCPYGLTIEAFEYHSIHETPCFHFCVDKYYKNYPLTKGETRMQMLKRMGVKVYRIGKNNTSRIAFPTKEQAYNHMRMLKNKQLDHIDRTVKMIETFLDFDRKVVELDFSKTIVIPESKPIIGELFVFD